MSTQATPKKPGAIARAETVNTAEAMRQMAELKGEAGLFDWAEFRRLLIEEIGIWDVEEHPEEDWNYYEHWAAAFEKLLAKKNFCAPAELDGRVAAFSSRPHGHNH